MIESFDYTAWLCCFSFLILFVFGIFLMYRDFCKRQNDVNIKEKSDVNVENVILEPNFLSVLKPGQKINVNRSHVGCGWEISFDGKLSSAEILEVGSDFIVFYDPPSVYKGSSYIQRLNSNFIFQIKMPRNQ